MNTKLRVTNPDEIKMELTMTMPLRDWKALQQQLTRDYPSWQLGSEINDMIAQATKHFYPQTTEPEAAD